MTDSLLLIEEIFGKRVTDICCMYGTEDGWLDTAECFIELDNKIYIEIPYGHTEDALVIELDPEADTIFNDLSDIPHYHVNKEPKTIDEVVEAHKKRKQNVFTHVGNVLFGYDPPIKEYNSYKIEYHENKLKYILNRTIVDYLWETERHNEKGFFELDNGYLISDQYMAPHGTGLAGLHYYDSLNRLKERKGDNLKRHTEETRGSR